MTAIWAGFEPAHLVHNDRDLLTLSDHTPSTAMLAHYQTAMAHGVRVVRDGLPWRHNVRERIDAVNHLPLRVIWDAVHFDPPPSNADHANQIVQAIVDRTEDFWICPVNEPSIWPILTHDSRDDAVVAFREINNIVRNQSTTTIKTLACDPVHGTTDEDFAALDAIVGQSAVDLLGINYYPYHSRDELHNIIKAVDQRYHLPICISETSWHQGHPEAHEKYPHVRDRAGWLVQMLNEIAISGVEVQGVCWYPWMDQVPWHGPTDAPRWPCGIVE